jgi:anaerobic magnesium-protoporphyrin IX monomethyl ester cyclase
MDVLLVNSRHNGSAEIPPLGLEYLAAVLLQSPLTVSILDLDTNCHSDIHESLRHELSAHTPQVVGVTAMSDSFTSALQILGIVKNYNPDILTVLGGMHATVRYEAILDNHDAVDVIVRGEGDYTFKEVVSHHLSRKSFGSIDGVSYRQNGHVVHTRERGLIKNLNALPLPAHHLVANTDYATRSISTSRGCVQNCSFCSIQSMYHRTVRVRSIESIIDEIEELVMNGARRIMFTDDNFTFSTTRITHLCQTIKARRLNRRAVFYAEGRIDDICRSPSMAGILSDAGFRGLYIGAESGSDAILRYYRKDITTEQIRQGVFYCIEQNLTPVVNFILYGPRDTVGTMKETISLAKRLFENGAEIAYAEALTPYPGTPLKDELEMNGRFRESEGVFYFDSYSGLDIDRTLELLNAARLITYLVRKDDTLFEARKAYYELSYLDELLDNRVPSDFEALRRRGDPGEIDGNTVHQVYGHIRSLLH